MPESSEHQPHPQESESKGFFGLHEREQSRFTKEGVPLGFTEDAEETREMEELGITEEKGKDSGLAKYREWLANGAEKQGTLEDGVRRMEESRADQSGESEPDADATEFTEADEAWMAKQGISPEQEPTEEQAASPEREQGEEAKEERSAEQPAAENSEKAEKEDAEKELKDAERLINRTEKSEEQKVFIFLLPIERNQPEAKKLLDKSFGEYFKNARDRIKNVRDHTPRGLKWLTTAVQAAIETVGALSLAAGKVGRRAYRRFKPEKSYLVTPVRK